MLESNLRREAKQGDATELIARPLKTEMDENAVSAPCDLIAIHENRSFRPH
jgi:hypothetical protein